jgi:Leucine-rich repeat (LRR) protein
LLNKIKKIDPSAFKSLKNLEVLYLNNNEIENINSLFGEELGNLNELYLMKTK